MSDSRIAETTEPETLKFRVLGCPVSVRCTAPGVGALLAEAAPRAVEFGLPAGREIEIEIGPGVQRPIVEVRHEGQLIYQHYDPVQIAVEVETLVTHLATGAWAEWVRVHAGCATIGGRRALFTGDKAAGKTTLMLALLAAGHAVHGDENVLLRGGVTLPVPRKFHLREGSLSLVPELEPVRTSLCRREHPEIGPFRFFDPSDLGQTWNVGFAPAAAVFILESGFGGPSIVTPCAKVDAVRHLLFQTMNLSGEPSRELREISLLAGKVNAFRLKVGELAEAIRVIEAALVTRDVHGS